MQMGSIGENGGGDGGGDQGERRASIHFSDHVETIVYDTDDPLDSPDAAQSYQARVLQLNYDHDGRSHDDPAPARPEAAQSAPGRPSKARPRNGRRPSRGRGRVRPPAEQARTVQQQFSMRTADGGGGGGGGDGEGGTKVVSYPSKPPLVMPTIKITDAEEDLRELFGKDYDNMMDDQQFYHLFLDNSHEDEGAHGREEEQRKEQHKKRRKEGEQKQRRKEEEHKQRRIEEEQKQRRIEEEQKQRRKEEEQKQRKKEEDKKQRRKDKKKKRNKKQEQEPSSNKAENDFDDIQVSDPY